MNARKSQIRINRPLLLSPPPKPPTRASPRQTDLNINRHYVAKKTSDLQVSERPAPHRYSQANFFGVKKIKVERGKSGVSIAAQSGFCPNQQTLSLLRQTEGSSSTVSRHQDKNPVRTI